MFEYPALFAVAAVVREGSFERAAHVLNITPSAVSQRIRLLEERIGAVLIVRGQPCTPTEEGRKICRHVERVAMLEQELRAVMPSLGGEEALESRITLPIATNADSLATWFLDAAMGAAKRQGFLLDLSVEDQDHTATGLRRGEVLAAVTTLEKPIPGCDSTPLGSLRYRATASPEFLERYFADGVNARTLAQAPGIVFGKKDTLQYQWVRRAVGHDVAFPTHWLPSTHGYVEVSLGGMGWGMNPALLVGSLLEKGALVELIPGLCVDVPLFWQARRLSSALLDELSGAVVKAARASLLWTGAGR
ncbi:LysR family transcriptional regulator ArgP [Pararhodospirillum oryzae]|uniref:LysR family transcriptional regulator n=1 Tax=Pararhodospirillum oryzae TaxID=478448 RepID=A0A512H465_9PROT|nr:LysR family transcriptional regulator ArgP [Pararhodospirillum oryzae]GEO80264.1 LysR family transcriptional regulator [Pararhodospirillum oryzae]